MPIIFPNIERAALTFGAGASIYGPMINDIAPYLTRERYFFEDNEIFDQKAMNPVTGAAYAARIYWIEILFRSHMAAVASIFRTTRWAEAAVREYDAGNLFGWAASCRSLMEAAGDTGHSLGGVPLSLAEHHRGIKAMLRGDISGPMLTSKELEDSLIHFSHARKISKGEVVPASHKAMQSAEYLRFIEEMGIKSARTHYAHLCELVHPAALFGLNYVWERW